MDMHQPEFFRYSRPKCSAFGHAARTKNPILAWQETKGFLDEFTEYKLTLPTKVELKSCCDSISTELINKITEVFGAPNKDEKNNYTWECDLQFNDQLNKFITNILEADKSCNNLEIQLHFQFRWKEYDSNFHNKYAHIFNHYIGNGFHGDFTVYLGRRIFIQPEFILIITDDHRFPDFSKLLINRLPFKFSEKSFISFYTKTLKNGNKFYKSISSYDYNF